MEEVNGKRKKKCNEFTKVTNAKSRKLPSWMNQVKSKTSVKTEDTLVKGIESSNSSSSKKVVPDTRIKRTVYCMTPQELLDYARTIVKNPERFSNRNEDEQLGEEVIKDKNIKQEIDQTFDASDSGSRTKVTLSVYNRNDENGKNTVLVKETSSNDIVTQPISDTNVVQDTWSDKKNSVSIIDELV